MRKHPLEKMLTASKLTKSEFLRRCKGFAPTVKGFQHEALRRWINGSAQPDLTQAAAMARVLGVTMEELVGLLNLDRRVAA